MDMESHTTQALLPSKERNPWKRRKDQKIIIRNFSSLLSLRCFPSNLKGAIIGCNLQEA